MNIINMAKSIKSKMKKLGYLLPIILFLNPSSANAQFKSDANRYNFDIKSKYIDLNVGDPFGLNEGANIRGILKLKYNDNSIYFIRNGLFNYYYGGEADIKWFDAYHNESRQNLTAENITAQSSPIGNVTTKTTLLNHDRANESGFILKYDTFFAGFENSADKNHIDGETVVDFGGQRSSSQYSLDLGSITDIYEAGFKYGSAKLIRNEQNGNVFYNYLLKADCEGLNLYYGKSLAGFLSARLFDKVDVDVSYDKTLKFTFATSDYSELNRRDFETNLENRLRAVPRIYNSNLETQRSYLEDMFFTKGYNFSISQDNVTFNVSSPDLGPAKALFHYSNDSQQIGLKLGPAIATYDFHDRKAMVGVFIK